MTTRGFNKKLDELIAQAVEYFQSTYVSQFRDHMKATQSPDYDESMGNVHIYSHIDTDGLCAASILSIALKREGINYHITILKQLEDKYLPNIASTMKENNEFLFFLDFGSGQLNLLADYLDEGNYIIIDHHQPLKIKREISISGFHVNCYFADINGSRDISGAGMVYLFAKKLRKDNVDSSSLAIVGAIGDHQNTAEQHTFFGENLEILQDALESKQIIQDVEPLLPRTISLPLGLANSLPDGINLFDNDVQKAIYFLKKIGVKHEDGFGHPRFLPDLSTVEKTILTSELVKKFLNGNKDPNLSIGTLLITNYLLPQFKEYPEIYDAKDFSIMINACGRLNIPSIGIACCVNRTNEMILKGIEAAKKYDEKLKKGIAWLIDGKKFTHLKAIEAFDGEDIITETIVGVICTILIDSSEYKNSLTVDTSKPIIGYSRSDVNNYKVSARCDDNCIRKGIDLSQAIRTTCDSLGLKSKGGGHPPAAGAFIPKEMIRQFLSELDSQVRIQVGEEKPGKQPHPKKTSKKTSNKKSKKPTQKLSPDSTEKSVAKKKEGLDQFWG